MQNVLDFWVGTSRIKFKWLFLLIIVLLSAILIGSLSNSTSLSALDHPPGAYAFETVAFLCLYAVPLFLLSAQIVSVMLAEKRILLAALEAAEIRNIALQENCRRGICPSGLHGIIEDRNRSYAEAKCIPKDQFMSLSFNDTLNGEKKAQAASCNGKVGHSDTDTIKVPGDPEKFGFEFISNGEENGLAIEHATTLGGISRDDNPEKRESIDPERLMYLLRSSPAVVYACEATGDHVVTFMSQNIRFSLGYEPEELLWAPKFRMDRIHPEDALRVLAGLSLLTEAGYYTYEYRFLHKNGTYKWMRDELRLMLDADGRPKEIVGSWFEISDQKRAED
ncbi:MAG: PAS domain-containing protein, partial [Desulfomonile tiedjei]|nr:PAS domain-containing protein [Desulfomonile tiedjei]